MCDCLDLDLRKGVRLPNGVLRSKEAGTYVQL